MSGLAIEHAGESAVRDLTAGRRPTVFRAARPFLATPSPSIPAAAQPLPKVLAAREIDRLH